MVNSTIYQEVQIKTIMRYHYTSTRMANIWTMMIAKLARIWSNRKSYVNGDNVSINMNNTTTLRNGIALINLSIHLPCDPVIPLTGI